MVLSHRKIGILVISSLCASSLVAPHALAQSASEGSRFTLGVLPDTQFYSRYSTPETGNLAQERYGSEPYRAQTEWLAENKDALNMQFATHLGDVVDQSDVEGEWKVADEAMRTLDQSDLNYSILPGNHDLTGDASYQPFNQWFGADRAKEANSTFQERFTGVDSDSEYHIFEAEGQEYLVLALAWRANNEVLDWAQQAIDEHPDLPVILTTHEVLNIDGSGEVFYSDDYGKHLWDDFISKNDQIFLTMGGHHHGAGYRVDKNDYGHDVVAILQDYQMAYQGGNGLLGVLEFDLTGNELEMAALSPWVAQKPQEELTQFDELILEGKGDSYKIPFNFAERFADFDPQFQVGDENNGDLAQEARDIVSAGYRPYEIKADELPQGPDDFVKNDNTVFHWRPGEAKDKEGAALNDGAPAGAGTIIPDIAGEGDLHREGGVVGADRVTYSSDHHPLSSDSGSLYWADPAGKPTTAEFKSAKDAAINRFDSDSGYTFESFVKLPEDFDGEKHGWGSAISRDSQISKLVPGSTDTDPTVMLGVSNLRELRWWAEPEEGSGSTVWSHEVPKDEWMHIAVVNDPEKDTVEMFINGAPILRNAKGAEGLLPRDLQWVMGAGRGEGHPQDPWYGWIGETRLSSGVLDKEQWLTARDHDAGASTTGSASGSASGSAAGSSTGSTAGLSSGASSSGGVLAAVLVGLLAVVGGGFALANFLSRTLGIPLPRLPF